MIFIEHINVNDIGDIVNEIEDLWIFGALFVLKENKFFGRRGRCVELDSCSFGLGSPWIEEFWWHDGWKFAKSTYDRRFLMKFFPRFSFPK